MEAVEVEIRVLGGQTLVSNFDPATKIVDLLKQIAAKKPVDPFEPEAFQVVFNGRKLPLKSSLGSAKVFNGAKLFLLPNFGEDSGSPELDLVFIVDTTGSMGSYIKEVQANIISIADSLVALESARINFGLVGYKDIGDSGALQVFPFDPDLKAMKLQVDKMHPSGGGDAPEMMASGFLKATELQFRPTATKIAVLITDAPPHGIESSGDNHPNGDPNVPDLLSLVRKLGDMGVRLFSIGCEPSITSYPRSKCFMKWAAKRCKGKYVSLQASSILPSVILSGCREEINNDKLKRVIEEELNNIRDDDIKIESEAQLLDELVARITARKITTVRMEFDNNEPVFDEEALFDKLETLAAVKSAIGTPINKTAAKGNPSEKATCVTIPVNRQHIQAALQAIHGGSASSSSSSSDAQSAPAASGLFTWIKSFFK